MKDILKSQLESYKRDNSKKSKQAMLSTLNAMVGTMTNNDSSTLNSIQTAKSALTSSSSNKNEIVQSVENVISNLS
ncbi:hypothetical protein SAMN05660462_01845 [Proteiniborus ethanoligenes]|uniref:Uncharacterized protein n=1 Tax=Proteiniborus ethanoligenes TaxID=415015 RepID=A0A1H3Q9E0_9FIRM|nr:hypothetical protein [Proteiniborus ethanoligenes]SDZ09997.1 hypothetical protein SAMN05660462_01845 [Proteiniborus ethanoligenes]